VVITTCLSTSFHESQYNGWSSRMPTIVSIYSKHAGFVVRLLNRTICYVWLYQKSLWLFLFEIHLISDITDGWQGCEPLSPPAKLNVKTEPRLAGILVFSILLVSVDCFFAFFGVFSGDFGFLYRRWIPDFLLYLNYFLSVSRRAPFS